MLASERYMKIVAITNEKGYCSTKELSAKFNVTQTSIRRDLEELEKQGLIIRVHGGSKSIVQDTVLSKGRETAMSSRNSINEHQKDIVCKKAASYIKDGSCIFLDGGSSIIKILPYINNHKVKIVSHSSLFTQFDLPSNIELFVVGGKYLPEYKMSVGPMAVNDLERFNFDIAFISCAGIDLQRRLVYTAEMDTMAVKQKAMQLASTNYLLVDDSKSNVKGFCSFISSDDFDIIISNRSDKYNIDDLPENFILVE